MCQDSAVRLRPYHVRSTQDGGRACIRDMRITVSLIVNLVANGMTADQILADYPYLEGEDIRQALTYTREG